MRTFKLHRPITSGPRVFTELTIGEPSARALLKLAGVQRDKPFETALAVISTLTGVEEKILEQQLSARDFFELSEVSAKLFSEMEND